MSKFKLLLFGLVISILSIGSFSNAINLGYNTESYFNIGNWDWDSFSNSRCEYRNNFILEKGVTYKFDMDILNNNSLSLTYPPRLTCTSNSQNFDFSSSSSFNYTPSIDCPGGYHFKFWYVGNSCSDFSVSVFRSFPVTLTSKLSPVITGLDNAIKEFIPYIVYIGLGVLGVIIGFVAIKWLLRYTKGKTLGVFSSRRKK